MTMKEKFRLEPRGYKNRAQDQKTPRLKAAMKRSRIEESQYMNVWVRMVMKLLFVMIRLTELSIRLVMGEKQMTDVEPDEDWEAVETEPAFAVQSVAQSGSAEESTVDPVRDPVNSDPDHQQAVSELHSFIGIRDAVPEAEGLPTGQVQGSGRLGNTYTSSPRRRSTWNNSKSTSRKGERSAITRETTRKGTNAFVEIERCLTCGKTLKSERKDNMEKEKVKKEPPSNEKADSEIEEEKQDYQEFMEFQKWKASKDKSKKHFSNKA